MLLSEFECPRTILIKQQQQHIFLNKKIAKNYPRHGTLDPRHGTLDPRPSAKDKDSKKSLGARRFGLWWIRTEKYKRYINILLLLFIIIRFTCAVNSCSGSVSAAVAF